MESEGEGNLCCLFNPFYDWICEYSKCTVKQCNENKTQGNAKNANINTILVEEEEEEEEVVVVVVVVASVVVAVVVVVVAVVVVVLVEAVVVLYNNSSTNSTCSDNVVLIVLLQVLQVVSISSVRWPSSFQIWRTASTSRASATSDTTCS